MTSPSTTIAPEAQSFLLPGGPVGVLVIHGYGGTIADYRQFSEALHGRGYTVAGVRLAGHGESLEALRATTASDWQASVRQAATALRQRCPELIVVGSSFGGALALNYACHAPDGIVGVVVVNPAVKYRAGGKFQTLALRLLRLFTADYRKPGLSKTEREHAQARGSMTHWPIDGIFETVRYIQTVVMPQLPSLTVPLLVMAMHDDPIVHSDSARMIFNQVASTKKKLVWLPGKTHRPFRDVRLVQTMVEEIMTFFSA